MSGRRSFSATVISRTSSENSAPSQTRAPGQARRKAGSIANALAGPGRPRRSLDSVFGNGNIANRRASENDSDPFAKHGGKGSQTVEEFDSDANKENIAPFRLVSLTTPTSPVRRRPVRRLYSDSFTVTSSLTSLDRDTPRVHVIKLASLDVEESDRESKMASPRKAKESISVATPPRLTKNTTTKTLEKDGKVLLRVEKAVHETDSSDSENSESDSDSDSGSEDNHGDLGHSECTVGQEDDKLVVPTEGSKPAELEEDVKQDSLHDTTSA